MKKFPFFFKEKNLLTILVFLYNSDGNFMRKNWAQMEWNWYKNSIETTGDVFFGIHILKLERYRED